MTHSPDRQDAALGWIVRTHDPEFDAWDAFTAWLEEDPANADAYHQLVQDELLLAPMIEALATPAAISPRIAPPSSRRRRSRSCRG
jgi:transmembrane sensor